MHAAVVAGFGATEAGGGAVGTEAVNKAQAVTEQPSRNNLSNRALRWAGLNAMRLRHSPSRDQRER
jgi:hypothetical protein